MNAALSRLARDTAYCVSALVLGILGFVLAVTGISVGLGLLVTVAGIFVLAGTAYAVRGLAHLERLRLGWRAGTAAPEASYRRGGDDDGWVRRTTTPLRDPQSWRDLLWALLAFVSGTVVGSLVLAWWVAALSGTTYWFWQRWLPDDPDDQGLAELIGLGDGRQAESLLQLAIGLAALVTLPFVVRGCAALQAGLGDALLVRSRPRTGPRSAPAGRPSAASA
jgi:hypothetical protein